MLLTLSFLHRSTYSRLTMSATLGFICFYSTKTSRAVFTRDMLCVSLSITCGSRHDAPATNLYCSGHFAVNFMQTCCKYVQHSSLNLKTSGPVRLLQADAAAKPMSILCNFTWFYFFLNSTVINFVAFVTLSWYQLSRNGPSSYVARYIDLHTWIEEVVCYSDIS